MAGLIAFLFGMLVPWWEGLQAQWHYGDSRVTQFDANVGHEGESHFTAYYHDGQVVVIEFPHDGDGTRTHVYAHRYVVHDRTSRLVTLKTKRLSGKPILVVSVEGVALPFVLYDTGTQYSVTPN